MYRKDDEEYKKRLERARQLRNSIGMSTENDLSSNTTSVQHDDEYKKRLEKAKQLRSTVGMITDDELKPKNDYVSQFDNDVKQENMYSQTPAGYNLVEPVMNMWGKALTSYQNSQNNYAPNNDYNNKKEIVDAPTPTQNVSLPEKNSSTQKSSLPKISLASSEEMKNAQLFTQDDENAMKKAQELNEQISKGGKEAFEAYVEIIGDNIYGGFAKKPIAGLANAITTATGLGIKGLEGLSRFMGFDQASNTLNNTYNDVIDFGSDINRRANYESSVTNQIQDDFTRTSGQVTDVVSNVLGNTAIGFVTGVSPTIVQGVSVGGNSAQEVLDKNKENIGQATVTGLAKGYTSYLTEKMFDANILTRGEASSISRSVDRLIENNIKSKLGKNIASKIVGVLGENAEELIEDNIDNLIDRLINNEDTPGFLSEEWWKNTSETAKVTTISTIILNLLGLGGETFEEKEKTFETEHWIDEAKKIIEQEDMAIHYDPKQVQNKDSLEQFYITQFTPSKELESITPTYGKEITNIEPQLMINPVIVKDSNTNTYEVIDGMTGVILDNANYETMLEAEISYNDKVNNLSKERINAINNTINNAEYVIKNNVMDIATRIEENLPEIRDEFIQSTSSNINTKNSSENKNTETLNSKQANYTTETVKNITDQFKTQTAYTKNEMADIWNNGIDKNDINVVYDKNGNIQSYIAIEEDGNKLKVSQYDNNDNIVQSEIIVPQNGKFTSDSINNAIEQVTGVYEQNSENKTPEKSKFYNEQPNYATSNINEIEKTINKKKAYTLEQIGEAWSDIQENTYNLTLDDDMYIELEENEGKLEAVLYDGRENDDLIDTIPEINRIEIVKDKNGKYTAEAINNAIKEAAMIQNENSPIQGQVDIDGNEVRSVKKAMKQNNADFINSKANNYNEAISRITNAINEIARTDLQTVIDNFDIYLKKGTVIFDDKKMKQKSRKNINPKIVETGSRYEKISKKKINEFADKAFEVALEKFQNKIILNKDTNIKVQLNKAGLDEIYSKNVDKIKINLADKLDQIVKEMVYGYTTIKENDPNNIKSHHFFNIVKHNGEKYLLRTIVREYPPQSNLPNKIYYQKIEELNKNNKDLVPPYTAKNSEYKDFEPKSSEISITQKKQNVKNTKKSSTKSNTQNSNIQDFGEKIGGARKDLSGGRTVNTNPGKEVIHDYTVQKADNGYTVNFKNKVLKDGFKTQAEAEQYILDFKNNIKDNRAFVHEMTNKDGENRYMIYLRNLRTLKSQYSGKTFANKQDAENYAMALSIYLKENGKNLFRPQIQKVDRENANNKNATKATGEDILKNFGFKGGEFGNWVTQKERQQFLNYAQDAFTDLAAALNITPESIGQQGAMNIAFGARGKGLTGAVAHFEPAKKVINMTRLKGAGSLAHEYGHSIDNYLSRIGGYSEDGMATGNARNPKLSDNMKAAVKEVEDAMRYNISTNQEEIDKKNNIYEKARKENLQYNLSYIDKVFNGNATKYKRIKGKYESAPIEVTAKQKADYQKIKNTLMNGELKGEIEYKPNPQTLKTDKIFPEPINKLQQMYKEAVGRKLDEDTVYSLYRQGKPARQITEVKSESGYSKSAKELDQATGRVSAYYSRLDEMWARAFESYISDKLKAKGIKDTYLVHSVNNNEYALFNPFPAGEERKNINKAFDNLIQTMKDEGYFKESEAPPNYDEDTGIRYMKTNKSQYDSDIRYMKKNKESKQVLAKQFKDITGDSITAAEAKLAGIELRNIQRQNGNLDGKMEEIPYSKEAMNIYNKYNNSKKSSNYLYHSTAKENLQNIIANGLTIGNKQNQEGISAKDKLYLAATEELAQSFAPNDNITFRINPNTKLENLSSDLLGGEGSYSITNNIPANMLQIKKDGKWVNLIDSSIKFAKRSALNENLRNAERGESYIEQEIQKIEKTGKWDDSIPITKLSDIRKTIEDYLGLGIKKGHFRQDAYAIYKGNNDVIRTKEYKDMDSILHETGHAMDLGNRLKVDKESIADELLTAIDRLGGYENESRTIRLEEGFAEVIREYAIIPEQAKKDFPQTIAVLEGLQKTDPKFNNFITKVQQQAYNYIHQNPRNRTLSNLSIGEQTDKQNITKNFIKQEVMRNIYDRDWTVKSAVNELAKANGKTTNQIKASENAYYLTRLSSGISDKVVSMLSDGYIDEKGNKLFPGLNQLGEILGNDTQRWNDLRAYLVAQRDLEYKAKTLKTGIRTMDSKAVIEQFKNDKQIKQSAKLVHDTLNGVMQYAVNNGLVSQETADKLKQSNAFYVPMQRVLENRGNQVGRRGAVADIIKQRTGSELDVKDVLENIIVNSSNIIQQVENNSILKAFYKEGQTTGLTGTVFDVIDTPMTKIGTQTLGIWEKELQKQGVYTTDLDLEKTIDLFAPNKKIDAQNLITSFINENGKRIYLQFNDEILFNSLMNMDKKFMSKVLKINSKMNMPLRYGATMANLGFAIPNMISDTAQATIYSTAGFIPVVDNALGVLDILASTNKSVGNFVNSVAPEYAKKINYLYSLYQQSGATSSTRMSQYRESTQNLMADVYGSKSKTLGIKEKYKPLKRLLDILTYIPEISEQSTRFEVFKKNYDYYKNKGTAEMDARILAALESRDATQDFGRTGNITREINQLIPFSAARVGSAYTFAEKLKANPKQVTMRIAILTAIAMAIKAMGYDDKEIEELNQRKKDDNFVMRVGDNVVTIKKPQGILRSIVNLAEYIQDLATDHIEDGKEGEKLGQWLNNAIMDNMPADEITGLVPNSVAPLIENAINKDFYYNTDIVKSYDQDLPDSDQYYDYNSQLAIWLGKIFNYSPAKIDNLISGYFGGLGTATTNLMDSMLGKAGVIPEKAEMGAEQDAIGKRFIVNVNTNSASIDEIYNRKTELTKKENGGTITSEEEKELDKIKSAISNMSDLNKQIKEIKKDPNMSGTEKAEKIRVLQQEKTDTARQALGKDLIYEENSKNIQSTQFYPDSTLKKNGYSLSLNAEQKKEYEQYAYEFYSKYENQGLYSDDKLKEIKTKAKDYAKGKMFQKYKSNVVKTK